MEFFEGLFRRFKKQERVQPKPEQRQVAAKDAVSLWSYSYFREYLRSLASHAFAEEGREKFLLPINQYPEQIELSRDWHTLFNHMRRETALDQKEKWAMIGLKIDDPAIYLQKTAITGLSDAVPFHIIEKTMMHALKTSDIAERLGSIHTHPRDKTDKSWIMPPTPTNIGCGHFSLTDMFNHLASNNSKMYVFFRPVYAVVEGNENLVILISQTTDYKAQSYLPRTRDQFVEEWYTKNGWKYDREKTDEGNGEYATPMTQRKETPIKDINIQIARLYDLAIYRGHTNGPLIRVFPPSISTLP